MERPRSGFAEVNGTRLYYEVAGQGEAVALVHGFTLDARMWDDQFAPLASRYRVIRHDVRGFGRSALPTDQPYTNADDLAALLRHLGVERAAVVGLSMGGGIAIDFALLHPAMTRAVIAIDAGLGGFAYSPEWNAAFAPIGQVARTGGVAAARERWLAHPLFAPAREQPAVAARLAEIAGDYAGWHWLNRDSHGPIEPAPARRLGKIGVPTLAIVGERDLPDFHRIADLIGQTVPGARTVVVPGAGHMASMEAPAYVNGVILRFLHEVM